MKYELTDPNELTATQELTFKLIAAVPEGTPSSRVMVAGLQLVYSACVACKMSPEGIRLTVAKTLSDWIKAQV